MQGPGLGGVGEGRRLTDTPLWVGLCPRPDPLRGTLFGNRVLGDVVGLTRGRSGGP